MLIFYMQVSMKASCKLIQSSQNRLQCLDNIKKVRDEVDFEQGNTIIIDGYGVFSMYAR